VEETWNCDDVRVAMGIATPPGNDDNSVADGSNEMLRNDAAAP